MIIDGSEALPEVRRIGVEGVAEGIEGIIMIAQLRVYIA